MVFSVRGSAGHVYRIVSTQGVMKLLTVNYYCAQLSFRDESAK